MPPAIPEPLSRHVGQTLKRLMCDCLMHSSALFLLIRHCYFQGRWNLGSLLTLQSILPSSLTASPARAGQRDRGGPEVAVQPVR